MAFAHKIQKIIDKQGWTDETIIGIVAEYFEDRPGADNFQLFLEEKAEAENEPEPISAEEIANEIKEMLDTWDGDELANLANQVRTDKVKYIGDSMFEKIE